MTDAKGNTTSYTYDSSDRLASVSRTAGDATVTVSYAYEDDRLKKITHNGFEYEFVYDAFGNRTSVKAAGTELMKTEYLTNNGLPSKYIYGNGCEIRNVYDKKGQLLEVYKKEPGGTEGKILTNFYDASGNLICQKDEINDISLDYHRDMSGRITGMDKSSGIAVLNPFRYRGYCYDAETGFYYLKSRYYDPESGRYLNADIFYYSGHNVKGYNMYTYCGNVPMNNVDPMGTCYYNLNGIMWYGGCCNGKGKKEYSQVQKSNGIAEDIVNFNWNNTDEEKVLDANIVSAYKGTLILKVPMPKGHRGYHLE